MTSDYERALTRAHAVGLKVMGRGEWTNGATFYVVTSASEAGRFHLVTVHAGRLSCDCTAGQHGRMCQHRALAHEAIERELETQPVNRVENSSNIIPCLPTNRESERRETAPMVQRPAFSIWASDR